MGKKNTARKLRRHPELLGQIMASAGKNQNGIDRTWQAAVEDLPELMAGDPREH
jgi:hypothetical protein